MQHQAARPPNRWYRQHFTTCSGSQYRVRTIHTVVWELLMLVELLRLNRNCCKVQLCLGAQTQNKHSHYNKTFTNTSKKNTLH
jgi:hypothetical protein